MSRILDAPLFPCPARTNPFRADRIDALSYRAPGFSWESFIDSLTRDPAGFWGAVVGPKGHGKTTLLEETEHRLQLRGIPVRRVRLNTETPPSLSALLAWVTTHPRVPGLLLLDGAEQLGPVAWWRLQRALRGNQGLLTGQHRDGRLPTIHRCQTSPKLLRDLVEELVADREDGCAEALRASSLAALFRQHRGNLRACFHALYQRWAEDDSSVGGSARISNARAAS